MTDKEREALKLSEWLRERNKQPTMEDFVYYEGRMERAEAALAAREEPPRDAAIESRDGWRLYLLLALFDRRGRSALDDLVQLAREGYERSGPDMNEDDAWAPFDARWARWDARSSAERLELAAVREEAPRARLPGGEYEKHHMAKPEEKPVVFEDFVRKEPER